MATSHDIRRLAFQTLYQLDARAGDDVSAVLLGMEKMEQDDETADFSAGERRKALSLASAAYVDRAAADAFLAETAPAWPSHRQAAVDRAILRLAHYEMTRGGLPPKVAVNEAVELAKQFSTEKSASFVNGVLDRLIKVVVKEGAAVAGGAEAAAADGEAGATTGA